MRTPFFIGVGGTGQTVLAAYLRLSNMAGFAPGRFAVVDSDNRGPLSAKLAEIIGTLNGDGGEADSHWKIDPFPTGSVERKTFGALFGNMSGERRELFDCLFSKEAERTPIRTGMYGRPSIGATCIRYKIQQNDEDLRYLKERLRGAPRHVVLVGSCFGGTGSGGVPILARELHDLNSEPGYDLAIDAVIFLPWFRLEPPAGVMADEDKSLYEHLNTNFGPNAAAGINFFQDRIREFLNSLILIGVRDPTSRVSNESKQGETVHALNLFTAVLIQNHFIERLKPPRGIAAYWYDDEHGLNPNNFHVYGSGNGSGLTVQEVINRTSLKQEWLDTLETFFKSYLDLPDAHTPLFLQAALMQLAGGARTQGQVLERVTERIAELRGLYSEHLDWVKEMDAPPFFTIAKGSARIQGDAYRRARANPLDEVMRWCDDEDVARTFEEEDLRTPEAFAGAFAGRFVDRIAEKFHLHL